MQSADWIKLLRRVPSDYVDNLSLVTRLGLEIAVQSIVQLDFDYAVVRGRMSGTNDGDKAFIVPYDQLSFVGFQRTIKEEMLLSILGISHTAAPVHSSAPAAPPATSSGSSSAPPAASPVAPPVKEPEPTPPIALAAVSGPPTPTKSPNMTALLERIRARSQTNGAEKTPQ